MWSTIVVVLVIVSEYKEAAGSLFDDVLSATTMVKQ